MEKKCQCFVVCCLLIIGFATCPVSAHAETNCPETCKSKPAGPMKNACLTRCANDPTFFQDRMKKIVDEVKDKVMNKAKEVAAGTKDKAVDKVKEIVSEAKDKAVDKVKEVVAGDKAVDKFTDKVKEIVAEAKDKAVDKAKEVVAEAKDKAVSAEQICPGGSSLTTDPKVNSGKPFCGVYCPINQGFIRTDERCATCESAGAQISSDGKKCVSITKISTTVVEKSPLPIKYKPLADSVITMLSGSDYRAIDAANCLVLILLFIYIFRLRREKDDAGADRKHERAIARVERILESLDEKIDKENKKNRMLQDKFSDFKHATTQDIRNLFYHSERVLKADEIKRLITLFSELDSLKRQLNAKSQPIRDLQDEVRRLQNAQAAQKGQIIQNIKNLEIKLHAQEDTAEPGRFVLKAAEAGDEEAKAIVDAYRRKQEELDSLRSKIAEENRKMKASSEREAQLDGVIKEKRSQLGVLESDLNLLRQEIAEKEAEIDNLGKEAKIDNLGAPIPLR